MEGGSSKKTKGKQKREMKKIENEKDLYTAFSKRKDGLYKKAFELKALVDADTSILMYSPCGNAHCFENPSMESIESTTVPPSSTMQTGNGDIYYQLVEDYNRGQFQQLKGKHDTLADQIYVEKEKKKQLERTLQQKTGNSSWEINMVHENPKDLEASLVDIQNRLKNRVSLHDEGNDVGAAPYPAHASNENAAASGSGENGESPFPPFSGYGNGYY